MWALTNQPHWVNELMFLLSMFLMLHYGIENHRKDARVPSYQGNATPNLFIEIVVK